MKRYIDIKREQAKKFNEFPCFFAFNEEQFNKGMESLGLTPNDTDKIYRSEGGMYYRKADSKTLKDLIDSFGVELKEAIENDATGETYIKDMFISELTNHEYCYTMDDTDSIEALGLTFEEIENSPSLKHGLYLAKKIARYEENYW